MNLEQALTLALLLLLGAGLVWFAHRAPRGFLVLYLLATTRFYGFADFGRIEVRGVVNVMFYLNLALLAATAIRLLQGKRPQGGGRGVLFAGLALFAFGVIYPTAQGHSDLVSSVTDGKDFLAYGLLGYLAVNARLLERGFLERMLDVLAVPLAAVVLLFSLTGLHPPAYQPVGPGGTAASIHFYHPTYVSLATLLGALRLADRPSAWGVIRLLLYLACLILQEHRSVMVATVGTLLLLGAYVGLVKGRQRLVLLGAALTLGLLLSPLGSSIQEKVRSSFTEIVDRGGAILSRERINSFRWNAVTARPLLGYGFIDEASSLGEQYSSRALSPFTRTLGTIDAGYLDLLVRFGAVGTTLLLALYLAAALRPLLRGREAGFEPYAAAFFLLGCFAVAYTWSVFSYEHGIVPGCLAVRLCDGGSG